MAQLRIFTRDLWHHWFSLRKAAIKTIARHQPDIARHHDLDPTEARALLGAGMARQRDGKLLPARSIKIVPPPASQRYQAARPVRISAGGGSRAPSN